MIIIFRDKLLHCPLRRKMNKGREVEYVNRINDYVHIAAVYAAVERGTILDENLVLLLLLLTLINVSHVVLCVAF